MPGTPAQRTIYVPPSAVPGHLGHGDTLGECPIAQPVTDEVAKTDEKPIKKAK